LPRWFGLRLDFIGNGLVLVLFVLIVAFRAAGSDALSTFAALALSSTSGLTALLSNLSVNAAEAEAKLNSVERIREYDTLEQEAPAVIPENRPPKDWPATGEVVFKDTSLRYRQGELVLKKLNLTVNGEEKVGIVGRTGAGKST
jgi:ATP-binding cassette subfamily C (CFTR/MRP) protein 1